MNLSDKLNSLIPNEGDDAEFIAEARRRRSLAAKADAEDREEAVKDVAFEAGDQWDQASLQIRKATHRPILTWNRLHTFCQQVSNDGRQNKPSVHVTPADGGNKATSDLLQGRIRQIEYETDADIAYDSSREQQVVCGRGFYRVTTEYTPGSFRQRIRIKPIHNQFSVLFDPGSFEYDRSDAGFVFVDTIMSKSAYRQKFGKDTPLSESNFFMDSENPAPEWIGVGEDGEHVMVAEYWVKEYKPRTLALLQNGETKWKDELPEDAAIKDTREEQDCTVVQYVIDGCSILSRTEWLGKLIPIIPVWGREEVVQGRKRTVSLIRYAHDAQKLVNLYVSNIAEQISMMPKTPYVGYEGQFENHEDEWEEINNIPRAFIQVKPVQVNGTILPLPQRVQSEPPIQALAIGLGQAVDALKAACNIYDASLGNAPNDASGLAIQRRNQESDMGNYHFIDNESRSRKLLGRILLELIPQLDADQEKVSIRTVEGKVHHVSLRTPVRHTDGSVVTHKLEDGSYEPHISTGPSYTSQRQEAYAIYSNLAQNDKSFMQIGGDILFRNMDAPGADQLADRYSKMLAPALQNPGDPAQMQGKLQQATQMIQQLSQQLHTLQDQLDAKKPELETRLAIAQLQEETKRENLKIQAIIAQANLQSKANTVQLQTEVGAIQHSLEITRSQEEAEFEALLAHYGSLSTDDVQGQQGQPDQTQAAPDPTAAQ